MSVNKNIKKKKNRTEREKKTLPKYFFKPLDYQIFRIKTRNLRISIKNNLLIELASSML